MIAEDILISYGAQEVTYEKNEVLFEQQSAGRYYFQVKAGEVKMYNLSEEGKEFTQGIFGDGQSFGEPAIIGDFPYPAGCMATKPSVLFRLSKDRFLDLLRENPEIHLKLSAALSHKLHYKAMILQELSLYSPEHRITTLLNYLKNTDRLSQGSTVDLTRREIAELTGLRVETVIRAIKKLETSGILHIQKGKIVLQ